MRIGCGPTPMLYYAAATLGVDGGVMVTGSHNPPDYNGFKFVFQGKPFYGAAIQRLGETCARARRFPSDARPGHRVRGSADGYIERLARDYDGVRAADRRLGCRKRRHRRGGAAADRPLARAAHPAERDDRRQLSGASSRSDDPREPRPAAGSGGARALRSRHRLRRRRRSDRRRRRPRADPVGRSADGRAGARCAGPPSRGADHRRRQGEPGAVRRDRPHGRAPGDGGDRPLADQGQARRDRGAARRRDERAHLLCRRLLRLRRCGLCRGAAARHPRSLGREPRSS